MTSLPRKTVTLKYVMVFDGLCASCFHQLLSDIVSFESTYFIIFSSEITRDGRSSDPAIRIQPVFQ